MAAYVIAQINITDPKIYEDYKALVPATVSAFGGEFVVRGGEQEALEGVAPSERTVVLRFPDMAAARAWHASPDYAKPMAIRQAASNGTLLLVDGVD
tara:strand:- start:50 stop:340 length:291 start_codon:yes stop_codon:yes gene_type:complete